MMYKTKMRGFCLAECSGNSENVAPMLPEVGHSCLPEDIDEIRKPLKTPE
jgi:hypothetical protein